MSAHDSGRGQTFPDAPEWAVPLNELPFNFSTIVVCIHVKPSARFPADEQHPNYGIAAPPYEMQGPILKTYREHPNGTFLVEEIGMEVNGEENTLRDVKTDTVYQMERKPQPFHVHRIPETWGIPFKHYLAKFKPEDEPSHMLTILIRGKNDTKTVAVLPPEVQSEIFRIMNEGKSEDEWVTAGLVDGVRLEVNISRALIRETSGRERIFQLQHYITRKFFSDPYEATQEDMFLARVFHETIGNTVETVQVMVDDRGAVHSRDTLALKSSNEPRMEFDRDGTNGFIANGELYTVPDPNQPYVIDLKGERRTIAHGEFMWVYELTEPDEGPDPKKTFFQAKPYDQGTSRMLEEAKLKGAEYVDIEITVEGTVRKYTVNLVSNKMYQYRKDAPNYARRVWRFGTPFKPELKTFWSYGHKLRSLTMDVPSYWKSKGSGASHYYPVDLTSPEGQKVLEYVQSSIQRYKGQRPVLGFGGKWLEQTGKEQPTTAGQPVHYRAESGEVVRAKTRAIHIAGIYRLEKPDHYLSYCAAKNSILSRRGEGLMDEPSSRYLSDFPLATGPVLDERVNEVWAFNGTSPDFAYKLLTKDVQMTVRAAGRGNTFGKGLYFADSIEKALKYCGCPMCSQQQRSVAGVETPCTCTDRNRTHPHIVFMTRLAMGKVLVVHDPAQFALHCWGDNAKYPRMGFDPEHPVVVWYDPAVSTEAEARAGFTVPVSAAVKVAFRGLPIAESSATQTTELWFFYMRALSGGASGYGALIDTLRGRAETHMKWLSFGIIVDDEASAAVDAAALELHRVLQARDANECFYVDAGTTLGAMGEAHQHDTDMLGLFRELHTEPGRGRRIELPDLARADADHADSVLVEDTPRCTPASVRDYPATAPSMLQARQNKRREMVMFDHMMTYSEYALLVYEYESPEAMAANLDREYPRNPHGVPPPCDPLHFLAQRFEPGDAAAAAAAVAVPAPDPPFLFRAFASPNSRGPEVPQTPPTGPRGLSVLGESHTRPLVGDQFTFEQP